MLGATYVDHAMPNVSCTAIAPGRVYFVDDGTLYLQTLGPTEPVALCGLSGVDRMFMHGRTLCVLCGPRLVRFKTTETGVIPLGDSVLLSGVPRSFVLAGDRLVFVHESSLEIVEGPSGRITMIPAGDVAVQDLCLAEGCCFVLSVGGAVHRGIDPLLAGRLCLGRPMVLCPARTGTPTQIAFVKNSLVLADAHGFSRYAVHSTSLVLEYSLSYDGRLMGDLFCGEAAVEIGTAPFACLNDRLVNYDSGVGVSASRVYFFEPCPCVGLYRETECAPLPAGKRAAESVTIPDFLAGTPHAQEYEKLVARLLQQETLVGRLEKMARDAVEREAEMASMRGALEKGVASLGRRAEDLRSRVAELTARASKVLVPGETDEFRSRVLVLDKMLDRFPHKDLGGLGARLRAQRAVLRGRLGIR